jgi:hypothetical protein
VVPIPSKKFDLLKLLYIFSKSMVELIGDIKVFVKIITNIKANNETNII